jgi:zinc transporter ZupT
VHSIPDSFESFADAMKDSDASEMTRDYAWPAWIAMMGVIICFVVEELVDSLSSHFGVANLHSHGHIQGREPSKRAEESTTHAKDLPFVRMAGECRVAVCETSPLKQTEIGPIDRYGEDDPIQLDSVSAPDHPSAHGEAARRTVKMLVLFFGLLFHVPSALFLCPLWLSEEINLTFPRPQNIFVGLALGTAENDQTLFIAIVFHQFFEGFGLGARVADSRQTVVSVLVLDFVFAAAAPVGIGLGLGVKSALTDGSQAYSIVDGTFQVLPLVDLLSLLLSQA